MAIRNKIGGFFADYLYWDSDFADSADLDSIFFSNINTMKQKEIFSILAISTVDLKPEINVLMVGKKKKMIKKFVLYVLKSKFS